jgi:8-oxo-dGTP diphosphatase
LAKRKYPPRVGYWGIPAGFLEYDESPVECCIREIREETGLEIKINRLFWSYPGHDDPRANAILTLYLAEIIGGSLSAGDDAVEVKFFGWDEIPANIAFQAHRQALADFKRFLDTGKLPSG